MEKGGEGGGKEGDGRIGYYLRIQGFCPADWSYLFNCYIEEVSVLYIIISLHMKKKTTNYFSLDSPSDPGNGFGLGQHPLSSLFHSQ